MGQAAKLDESETLTPSVLNCRVMSNLPNPGERMSCWYMHPVVTLLIVSRGLYRSSQPDLIFKQIRKSPSNIKYTMMELLGNGRITQQRLQLMNQIEYHKHRICSAQLQQFIGLLANSAGTKLCLPLIRLLEHVLV